MCVELIVEVDDLGVVLNGNDGLDVDEVGGDLGGADAGTKVCEGFWESGSVNCGVDLPGLYDG